MKNNYLAHYGVKGQRWGFRKKREVPYSDHIRQINKQYKNPFRDSILKKNNIKKYYKNQADVMYRQTKRTVDLGNFKDNWSFRREMKKRYREMYKESYKAMTLGSDYVTQKLSEPSEVTLQKVDKYLKELENL